MNIKRTVSVTILASLLAAASLTAMAEDKPDAGRGTMRSEMHADMRAYRDAVMSGALTDRELAQLKKDREAAHEQMRKIHDELRAKTQALISNSERGPKRDKWPDELAGKAHGQHKLHHHRHHGDGKPQPDASEHNK